MDERWWVHGSLRLGFVLKMERHREGSRRVRQVSPTDPGCHVDHRRQAEVPRDGGWMGEHEEGGVWEGEIDGPAGRGTMGVSGPGPQARLGQWRQVHSRGARMWSLRACTVRAWGAQVAVPRAQPWGELESKEPGSRWRCHAPEKSRERESFQGWAGGRREEAGTRKPLR